MKKLRVILILLVLVMVIFAGYSAAVVNKYSVDSSEYDVAEYERLLTEEDLGNRGKDSDNYLVHNLIERDIDVPLYHLEMLSRKNISDSETVFLVNCTKDSIGFDDDGSLSSDEYTDFSVLHIKYANNDISEIYTVSVLKDDGDYDESFPYPYTRYIEKKYAGKQYDFSEEDLAKVKEMVDKYRKR